MFNMRIKSHIDSFERKRWLEMVGEKDEISQKLQQQEEQNFPS